MLKSQVRTKELRCSSETEPTEAESEEGEGERAREREVSFQNPLLPKAESPGLRKVLESY